MHELTSVPCCPVIEVCTNHSDGYFFLRVSGSTYDPSFTSEVASRVSCYRCISSAKTSVSATRLLNFVSETIFFLILFETGARSVLQCQSQM